VLNVNEQLPVLELRGPLQLSPVLALTLTLPVGTPFPVAPNATVTAWPTSEGLGVCEVIVVALLALLTTSVTVAVAVV
jgi:hypothetical protein